MDYRLGTPYDTMRPAVLAPGHSGYFSSPDKGLDPRLFLGDHLRSSVRQSILALLYRFWHNHYREPLLWSRVWLAGSAVSYQWNADRESIGLGDLDCLIGVDWPAFLQRNFSYSGLTPSQIAATMNEGFQELHRSTSRFMSAFDLTFYVNPTATDIREIHPYAAYDLTADVWTVEPIKLPQDWGVGYFPEEWRHSVLTEIAHAKGLVGQYNHHQGMLMNYSVGSPQWRNASATVGHTVAQIVGLFDDVHSARKQAFQGSDAQGYASYYNYRWQSHKLAGTLPALKAVKDAHTAVLGEEQVQEYGEPLTSADKALRQAALYRRSR